LKEDAFIFNAARLHLAEDNIAALKKLAGSGLDWSAVANLLDVKEKREDAGMAAMNRSFETSALYIDLIAKPWDLYPAACGIIIDPLDDWYSRS
jgi:hypothetical protein